MKLSKDNFSEWYSKVLEEMEILDMRYPVKGMPVYMGWGFAIMRKCFNILEDLLEKRGNQPMLFPLLIPEENLKKEGEHIKGFENQVIWTNPLNPEEERRLAIRPTSETAIHPMLNLWVRSHADLPFKMHQTVCVYRHETKATRPLIRGREVYWNEAHTAHADAEDCEKQIAEAVQVYKDFFKALCIPYKLVKRPDHDKFAGADYSVAFDMLMPDGKVLQGGTVHNLGQNFAKVYGITYDDEKGKKQYVYQTSYGISMRCLALLVSIHGDDKGLILPPVVAPIQVIIIPIFFGDREQILTKCRSVLQCLKDTGIRVKIDARDTRPGEKYYHWEGRGVPIRIEIGPKDIEKKQVVMVNRFGEKTAIPEDEVGEKVLSAFVNISEKLRGMAEADLKSRIHVADDLEGLGKAIKRGGIVQTGWCGSVECSERIGAATGAEVRGTPWGEGGKKAKCAACGKECGIAFVAKTY
ncbi:MAG: proline--tRNA ligase [Candidatus Micrarchaeota archaeon]